MNPRKNADAEPSFEDLLRKLEEIVRKLEDEELPLETALKLFAEGQSLARACETRLQAAENQVRLLMQAADGSVHDVPLSPERANEVEGEARPGAKESAARNETSNTPPPPESGHNDVPF